MTHGDPVTRVELRNRILGFGGVQTWERYLGALETRRGRGKPQLEVVPGTARI